MLSCSTSATRNLNYIASRLWLRRFVEACKLQSSQASIAARTHVTPSCSAAYAAACSSAGRSSQRRPQPPTLGADWLMERRGGREPGGRSLVERGSADAAPSDATEKKYIKVVIGLFLRICRVGRSPPFRSAPARTGLVEYLWARNILGFLWILDLAFIQV